MMNKPTTKAWSWQQLGLGILGFAAFIFALGLMKEGAHALTPLLRGSLAVSNAADSLGLGWLMAYVIQSGSPVAAAAVSLQSAGTLTPLQGFMMIAGSRVGAGLMILQIGLLYALRGHERWTALTAGVLTLLLTGSILLVSVPLGLLVLQQGWLDSVEIPALQSLADGINLLLEPLIRPLAALLPGWALFVLGVGLVTLSFKLLDNALPQINLKETGMGQINRLIYRPGIMFLLGLAVTMVTMSVSISVGILVPLSARGYMRRENIIPYILGANISTLVDTLIAALLLGDPATVTVVLTHMVGATVVSLPIALLFYQPYERVISGALAWITAGKRNFAWFIAAIFVIPVILILF